MLPNTPPDYSPDLERMEIDALLEVVYKRYGFDFRSYAYSSLKRRLWKFMEASGLTRISLLQDAVLHDRTAMEGLLTTLSIKVTSMFRDPSFYAAFRATAIPHLSTYPFIRIWHAGCATGEEVYSMAIMLREEGLLERTRIYATDMNSAALETARAGIYPLDRMKEYTKQYLQAGGKGSLSDYYTARYDHARLDPELTRGVVFAQHNLAVDAAFAEVTVVVCRNVMIYFDRTLQERVYTLFSEALVRFGILALGTRESVRATPWEGQYEALDERNKIYRRVGAA